MWEGKSVERSQRGGERAVFAVVREAKERASRQQGRRFLRVFLARDDLVLRAGVARELVDGVVDILAVRQSSLLTLTPGVKGEGRRRGGLGHRERCRRGC